MLVVVFSIVIGLAGIGSIIWGVLQPVSFYLSSTQESLAGVTAVSPQVKNINQAAANLNMVFAVLNIIIAPLLIWGSVKCCYKKKYAYLANVIVAAAVFVLVRYVIRLMLVKLPLQEIASGTRWGPTPAISYNTLMIWEFCMVCVLVIFYTIAFFVLHWQIKREQSIPVATISE